MFFADENDCYVLISLQVLSGKQPWSEVREDAAVVFRLAKGQKPGRPESQTLHDPHWDLIQQCWSPIEERPPTEDIVSSIKTFLSRIAQRQSLRDVVLSSSHATDSHDDQPLPFPFDHAFVAAGSSRDTKTVQKRCVDDCVSDSNLLH